MLFGIRKHYSIQSVSRQGRSGGFWEKRKTEPINRLCLFMVETAASAPQESEPRPASGAASCPPIPMVAIEWRSSLMLAACTWLLIQTISTKNKTEPINRLCLFMVETAASAPQESEPRPASGAASCPPLPMVAIEWRSSLILAACTWLLIQTISTKNKTEPINRLCLFMVEINTTKSNIFHLKTDRIKIIA